MSKTIKARLAIAVPTYNEAKNLPKLVNRIKLVTDNTTNVDYTLLIIDDNSPDGTSIVAKNLAKGKKTKNFRIKVLKRRIKQGLGSAYIDGFKYLLSEKRYDYILQMDADLSHDPKYIPNFLDSIQEADLIVGSRYIKGGGTPDWTILRKLLSRAGNLYACLILGTKIHDYTGGYNMYSSRLLKKINFDILHTNGYSFLLELKYVALNLAKHTKEVPIIFIDRKHGVSKMPKNTLISSLLLVPFLKLKSINGYKKAIQ